MNWFMEKSFADCSLLLRQRMLHPQILCKTFANSHKTVTVFSLKSFLLQYWHSKFHHGAIMYFCYHSNPLSFPTIASTRILIITPIVNNVPSMHTRLAAIFGVCKHDNCTQASATVLVVCCLGTKQNKPNY